MKKYFFGKWYRLLILSVSTHSTLDYSVQYYGECLLSMASFINPTRYQQVPFLGSWLFQSMAWYGIAQVV